MKEASLNMFGRFKEAFGVLIRTKLCVNKHTLKSICECHVFINNLSSENVYNLNGRWRRTRSVVEIFGMNHKTLNTSVHLFSLFYLPFENKTKQNKRIKKWKSSYNFSPSQAHSSLSSWEKEEERGRIINLKHIFTDLFNWIRFHCLFSVNKSVWT